MLSVSRLNNVRDSVNNECGAKDRMRIDRGDEVFRGKKPGPVPLCLPQIPHDLTWN